MISCNGCCKRINEDNTDNYMSTAEGEHFCNICAEASGLFLCDWCNLGCLDENYSHSEDYESPEFCTDCLKKDRKHNYEQQKI